jgi:hypothetical protein
VKLQGLFHPPVMLACVLMLGSLHCCNLGAPETQEKAAARCQHTHCIAIGTHLKHRSKADQWAS